MYPNPPPRPLRHFCRSRSGVLFSLYLLYFLYFLYLLYFHQFAHSFALPKSLSPFFSIVSALFLQITRGVVCPVRSVRSSLHSSRSTGHVPRVTNYPLLTYSHLSLTQTDPAALSKFGPTAAGTGTIPPCARPLANASISPFRAESSAALPPLPPSIALGRSGPS